MAYVVYRCFVKVKKVNPLTGLPALYVETGSFGSLKDAKSYVKSVMEVSGRNYVSHEIECTQTTVVDSSSVKPTLSCSFRDSSGVKNQSYQIEEITDLMKCFDTFAKSEHPIEFRCRFYRK